jgi:acetylornithine deacetylase
MTAALSNDPVDRDPIALAAALVAIESVNPDLVPGAAGEAAIAAFCADWLRARGFEVHRLEPRPGRPSIVGVARGRGGGRSLMLNGHLDTVSHAGYDGDPLGAGIRDGKLFGRGAFDMKSGVAAIMVAAARAAARGLAGDVIVALVADEEFGSLGTETVLRHFRADSAIIAEPSGLELVLAHRGFAWFDLGLRGRAAHGSMPELGIDAIAHAARVLAALGQIEHRLGQEPPHPLLGRGAVRVAQIAGGEDAGTVAAACRLTIERRMLPGESPAAVESELRRLLAELAAEIPDFSATLTTRVARAAWQADPGWPIVETLTDAASRVLGRPPGIRGEPFWTDAGLFSAAGIPGLLFGASGGGAHAATEWVDVASITALAEILERAIVSFAG